MSYSKTLYKRDNLGNIREWFIETEADKYRTVTGIMNGAKVTSGWTVCEAKNVGRSNATTVDEQSILEAKALVKKKMEQGGYFESVDNVDDPIYFEPMLAKQYEDFTGKFKFPVFSQPKLDGIRNAAKLEGFFSRQGKQFFNFPHLVDALARLREDYPDIIFDGEFYNHELRDDFNTITSIVKKQKPSLPDIQKAEKLLEYHIYDLFDCNNPEMTFDQRQALLERLFWKYTSADTPLKLVETDQPTSQQELDELYGSYMSDGYEGQMIRFDQPYENKRSKYLLKRKEFKDEEFEIIDIMEGLGNWSGYAKAVKIKLQNGNICDSGIRGNQEFTKKLLAEKAKYIGGQATVRYQNLTPDGVPRFPVVTALFEGKRDI